MVLKEYVDRIVQVARTARSELKLGHEISQTLRECLTEFGVTIATTPTGRYAVWDFLRLTRIDLMASVDIRARVSGDRE